MNSKTQKSFKGKFLSQIFVYKAFLSISLLPHAIMLMNKWIITTNHFQFDQRNILKQKHDKCKKQHWPESLPWNILCGGILFEPSPKSRVKYQSCQNSQNIFILKDYCSNQKLKQEPIKMAKILHWNWNANAKGTSHNNHMTLWSLLTITIPTKTNRFVYKK